MKVLFIAHSSEIQGSGKSMLALIQTLQKLGVEIEVLLPGKGPLCNDLKKMKVPICKVPFYLSVYPPKNNLRDFVLYVPRLARSIVFNVISLFQTAYIVKLFKPDLIHTNVGPIHIGSSVSRLFKIPHVWHIREYQEEHFGWIPFPSLSNFLRKTKHPNNHLVSITKGLFQHYQMSQNKDYIVYNGVVNDVNVPSIAKKKNYFLFVGNISEDKGFKEMLNAFIEISHQFPTFNLFIAGTGSEEMIDYLNENIIKSSLSNRILYLGFRKNVNQLMAEASAIIISSRSEGFGRVMAEAMYNGCLVIGKNAAGIKEQFDNGLQFCDQEIGIRYSDYGDLVSSLKNVCRNGVEHYLHTINLAQKTVLELYSMERSGRRIFQIYNEILENGVN